MALRDFLDDILSFIDSESLTDDEFETIGEDVTEDYTKAGYDALKAIIQERDGVSGQLAKLNAFYTAKGVDLTGKATRDAVSQIFVGGVLD